MDHDVLSFNLEPGGYDSDGYPMYDDDLLDMRWRVVMDDLDAVLGRSVMLDIENGACAIRCIEDPVLRRRTIELLVLLVDREDEREANPNLLSVEEGEAWRRRLDVDALRAQAERYAQMAARAGWPADPDELDATQLSRALLVVLHPELIEDLSKFEEPPDT